MSTASAPRPTYNPHKGEVDCISCAKEEKAVHLSRKDKLLVHQ